MNKQTPQPSPQPGRGRIALRLLLVAPLFLAVFPDLVAPLRPAGPPAGAGTARRVRVEGREAALRIEAAGGRRLVDYGGFAIYELPAGAPAALTNAAGVQPQDGENLILLNSGAIDTGEEIARTQRKAAAREGAEEVFVGRRLHLVKLVGPARPGWMQEIRATGVRVVSYIPHNAFLVYGDDASLRALRALARGAGYVTWEGPYRSEHRLQRSARATALSDRLRRRQGGRREPGAPGVRGGEQAPLYAVQLVRDDVANPATRAALDALGRGGVRSSFQVRDLVNLIVPLEAADLAAVAARDDVVSIQAFAVPELADERQAQIMAGQLAGTTPSGPGYLEFLAGHGLTQAQFDAAGFLIDISDSGLDSGTTTPSHPGLHTGGNTAAASRIGYVRLEGLPIFGNTTQGCDGHGTINAHIAAGFSDHVGFPWADADGYRYGLGIAPFVRVGGSVIFAPSFTYPSFPDLQARAYRDGARISSNSWGGLVQGAYDINSQAFDALVRDAQPSGSAVPVAGNQQMVIVVAAGNEGLDGLRSPGTAKNVISVGASENVHAFGGADGCGLPDAGADDAEDMADFSSRGPTQDGRVKPDIVAPGTHVTGGLFQSATPGATGEAAACFDGTGTCGGVSSSFFPAGQEFYTASSGTSHSTPAVAGAAALLRQHLPNRGLPVPSPAMTRAWLLNGARYLAGAGAGGSLPSPSQGMGALDLEVALDDAPRIVRDQDPSALITATGQTVTYTGTIADTSRPFRVTLAWTDAPGSTTGAAYNNDLDLKVVVAGTTYRGNVFSNALSVPGGTADPRNNVESVFLPAGTSGSFSVTITAANINSDGVPGVGASLDQDFALVVYNAHEEPQPAVVASGATLVAESCGVGNGAIDPGEEVSVAFALANVGTLGTGDLVATLLPTGGVTQPSAAQSYGALPTGGATVTRTFSFVAGGSCGGRLTATLSLEDAGAPLGEVQFLLDVGAQVSTGLETLETNPGAISVPVGGAAAPYPSALSVAGLPGRLESVRVTLHGLRHPFPDDLDVLLVAPDGRGVVLMSDAGGGGGVSGVELTFDDAATNGLPDTNGLTSGSWRPTNHEGAADEFPAPAPEGVRGLTLGSLAGGNPNGTWQLFVVDDFFLDGGSIDGGWTLALTTTTPVCCGGSPGFSVTPTSGLVTSETGGTATFDVTLTAAPQANVRIPLSSSDPSEGTVEPAELVFTPLTAFVPQSVTLRGVDDAEFDGSVAWSVITGPSVSTDPAWAGLDPPDVSAANLDDEVALLAIGDKTQPEGASGTSAFVFSLQLSPAVGHEVRVDWSTADGSAVNPGDYAASSGTAVFAPGETSRAVSVSVVGDATPEPDESFTVRLSNPQGAALSDPVGTGTIVNDDIPSLTPSATAVAPGASVQALVENGPGSRYDWVALAPVGGSHVDWQYLSGTRTPPASGLTTALLTFTMPTTQGSYEFRLYANDGYTLLAKSPTITVALTDPVMKVTPTSLAFGNVTPGAGANLALTVTNIGVGTLVGSASVSGSPFSIVGTPSYSLGAGASATLMVRFAPAAAGDFTGTVTLSGAAGASVALSGRGASPPSVTPSATAVAPGASVQVRVENGPGSRYDWVALAPVGGSHVDWQYLSGTRTPPASGLTTALLTFTMPTTQGSYEFRLYANDGYTLVAKSPTISVALTDPVMKVTPTSLAFGNVTPGAGANLALTVTNIGVGTLVGSASVSGSPFSIVGTPSYSLGAGASATLMVRFAPAAAGDFTGTVTLSGAAGASVALSGRGASPPSVTPSATAVAPGASVQVRVENGPGSRYDWVALAPVGGSHVDWQYLSGTRTPPASGLTTALLTFTMPTTQGSYEFRLYANDGYTLVAKSPTISVALTDPVMKVTPTSLAFGNVTPGAGANLALTVTNIGVGTLVGSASVSGSPFSIVGTPSYSLGAGASTTLVVRFAPAAAGDFTGTVTLSGAAGASVALSGRGASPPSVTPSATAVAPGASVQALVENGPGSRYDWVALAPIGGSHVDWQYLSGTRTPPASGLTTALLTFTMPTTQGSYEFRLYANDGYTLLAKSPTVTVRP